MSTHTPGPWEVEYVVDGAFEIRAASDITDYMQIAARAQHPKRHAEMVANAHLIAAAPDLLAVLKEYIEWGAMTGSDRDLFDSKFREAIAKAEGKGQAA